MIATVSLDRSILAGNQMRLTDFVVQFPHQAGSIKWLGDPVIVPAAISHGVLVEHNLKKLFPKCVPKKWFFIQIVWPTVMTGRNQSVRKNRIYALSLISFWIKCSFKINLHLILIFISVSETGDLSVGVGVLKICLCGMNTERVWFWVVRFMISVLI